jgi:hypothetical protein
VVRELWKVAFCLSIFFIGEAEWLHKETFSIPSDTLSEVPFAKNVAWINSPAERLASSRLIVIYGVHGMM